MSPQHAQPGFRVRADARPGMTNHLGERHFAGTATASGFANWPACTDCAALAASASAARRFGASPC